MQSFYISFSLFFIFIYWTGTAGSAADLNSNQKTMDSELNSAIMRFSLKFLNELEKEKSVVSSPLSAKFVLALVALGCSDNAHQELLTALGFKDDQQIRDTFSSLSSKLRAVKGVTLNVANKVYVMEGDYDLQTDLKKDAVEVFDAAFEKVDFAQSAAAASLINSWVEDKTNQKIKDLIAAACLGADTRLVLVNAIYFKGTWKNQFNPRLTKDRTFFGPTGEIQIPMMHNSDDRFRYAESEGLQAQLLEMPYVGGEASMVIVLPREVDGLNGLLAKLADGYDLMADIERMHAVKVIVTIPKFKIETEIDLNELLPKLGIKQIFDQRRSGLTKVLNTDEPLYVSKAIQKAFIEINEEGAEAAAATGMVMMMRCAPRPPAQFCADRPFLYLLNQDRASLFIGVFNGKL